jgi:hypothetical protein
MTLANTNVVGPSKLRTSSGHLQKRVRDIMSNLSEHELFNPQSILKDS